MRDARLVSVSFPFQKVSADSVAAMSQNLRKVLLFLQHQKAEQAKRKRDEHGMHTATAASTEHGH